MTKSGMTPSKSWSDVPVTDRKRYSGDRAPSTIPMFPSLEPEIVSHNTVSWMMAMMAEAKKRVGEGQSFSVADLIEAVGPVPGHYNKIGPTIRWISVELGLREVGRVKSTGRGHGRKISVWGK